jgi:hypothetical protein
LLLLPSESSNNLSIAQSLLARRWDRLQPYLFTLSERDKDFALLISQLFPNLDELDGVARAALSFEAKSFFLALDDLKTATRDEDYDFAEASYAKLLLSYDRFLKAGGLYDTYDPIASTEVFFSDTPLETLRFDKLSRVQVRDRVVLVSGPDMGKAGYVVHLEPRYAVVKLDKDGRNWQEVKQVKMAMLAKALDD